MWTHVKLWVCQNLIEMQDQVLTYWVLGGDWDCISEEPFCLCLFVLNKGKEQWLRVDALYPAEIGCISYRTLWCDLAKLGWIEFLTINDMTVQIICLCFSWLRTLWFWGFNHMQDETPKPLRTGKNQSQDPTGHMPLSFSLSDLIPFLTPVWGYMACHNGNMSEVLPPAGPQYLPPVWWSTLSAWLNWELL